MGARVRVIFYSVACINVLHVPWFSICTSARASNIDILPANSNSPPPTLTRMYACLSFRSSHEAVPMAKSRFFVENIILGLASVNLAREIHNNIICPRLSVWKTTQAFRKLVLFRYFCLNMTEEFRRFVFRATLRRNRKSCLTFVPETGTAPSAT